MREVLSLHSDNVSRENLPVHTSESELSSRWYLIRRWFLILQLPLNYSKVLMYSIIASICLSFNVPAYVGITGSYPSSILAFGSRILSRRDRKSTRLNSSHVAISYAVFCSR